MKHSLLNSNPWLRDPAQRAALLRTSAATSSAVEGIVAPFRERPRAVTPARRKGAKSAPARG